MLEPRPQNRILVPIKFFFFKFRTITPVTFIWESPTPTGHLQAFFIVVSHCFDYYSLASLQNRRYLFIYLFSFCFFFFRLAKASTRRTGARMTRNGRGAKPLFHYCFFFAPLPSRVTRAPRSSRACLYSPEKRQKTTPVLQATHWLLTNCC